MTAHVHDANGTDVDAAPEHDDGVHCDHHQHDDRCRYDDDCDTDDYCVHCECCCTCLGCEYGPRDGLVFADSATPEARAALSEIGADG